jgi:hypothetical protein
LEAVIRTRAELEANFTALFSEFKTESASPWKGPSWEPTLSELFPGKSKQETYDWFLSLGIGRQESPLLPHFFETMPLCGDEGQDK